MKRGTQFVEGRHYEVLATGCWNWLKQKTAAGYGLTGFGGKYTGAHRRAWELAKGPIPAGLCVCHSCDNPGCVNPDHLWIGTQADNMRDSMKKHGQKRRVGALPHPK